MLLVALALGAAALVVWCQPPGAKNEPPLSASAAGKPDFRFHILPAWETVQIPLACRFDSPLGTAHAGFVYNAQPFWEMNAKRGGRHSGDDLNGIGGMNTDLGDPVFSVADGRVLYVGEPSAGWGKLVVIGHKVLDGRMLHSMYAHLEQVSVSPGNLVARGQPIATVGTANGYYLAHLHFEIRESDGIDIGAGYAMHPLNRLDPTATVSALRNATADDLAPSPLGIMLEKMRQP